MIIIKTGYYIADDYKVRDGEVVGQLPFVMKS